MKINLLIAALLMSTSLHARANESIEAFNLGIENIPDSSPIFSLSNPGSTPEYESDLDHASPLGRGIRAKENGRVIQLYCLKKDPSDQNACIQAQYAMFNDDELLPKDSLGNELVRKRNLHGIGPVLTIESAGETKKKLLALVKEKRSPHLKMSKVKFRMTQSVYGKHENEHGQKTLNGSGTFNVATAGSSLLLGTLFFVNGTAVGAATGIIMGEVAFALLAWPIALDVIDNSARLVFDLGANSVKLIVYPFKRLFGPLGLNNARAMVESFTNKDGYNWSERPLSVSKRIFDEFEGILNQTH